MRDTLATYQLAKNWLRKKKILSLTKFMIGILATIAFMSAHSCAQEGCDFLALVNCARERVTRPGRAQGQSPLSPPGQALHGFARHEPDWRRREASQAEHRADLDTLTNL
jgi:hypothetical protein